MEEDRSYTSAAIKFAGFLSGAFIFLHFLTESEASQVLLFLSFIGLLLGVGVGVVAYQDVRFMRAEERRRRRELE